MSLSNMENKATYIRLAALGDLEILSASYTTHSFSRHWHDTFGIGITEKGVETFDYDGIATYSTVGNVVLINPGVVHTGKAVNAEIGWKYRIMYPSPKSIQDIYQQLTGRQLASALYFPEPVVKDPECANQLYKLFVLIENSSSILECQSAFVMTMSEIIRRHTPSLYPITESGAEYTLVNTAQEYIQEHYAENISLSELATLTGFSQFYFVRAFQKHVGVPPHTYLILARIQKAKELLRKNYPLSSVAIGLGFTDQSHFTRHFKRVVGVTPKQFMCKI
jgi:AraC-like DNA-binding protein